ncbi:MAG: hypothetical protein IT559_05510 [Alphaproteobacteria bacterium]|nr:hypothetical protein [Alphaproteobacteria bacterium]
MAWGNGFRYDYTAPGNLLGIAQLGRQEKFASLRFDHSIALAPLRYVMTFEKTNQIKALMYSNNTTTDLGRTVSLERMTAILESTAKTSRYAYELQRENLEDFAESFAQDMDLKTLKIRKFQSRTGSMAFYAARIQTRKNNTISVHGCLLSATLAGLAEKVLHDLLPLESGYRFERPAQKLLRLSSELATLSRIMDDNFIPEHRMPVRLLPDRPLSMPEIVDQAC